MTAKERILVTGAAGQIGGVGRSVTLRLLERGLPVRAMVHRDDDRAAALRAAGAEIVVGDLVDPTDVLRALTGCQRIYFGMSISAAYLEATLTMAAVAREVGVDALVNMSQMTVSQMSLQHTTPSHQQRQHWLGELALAWSGLPVVTVRPTMFLESLVAMSGASIRERDRIELPFGHCRTSPIAGDDVARVVSDILASPGPHLGKVYELTGARSEEMDDVARELSEGLHRQVTYVDVPPAEWEAGLSRQGVPEHTRGHLAAMAELHRAGRYDRWTDGVQRVTGRPPMSVREFAARHSGELGPPGSIH